MFLSILIIAAISVLILIGLIPLIADTTGLVLKSSSIMGEITRRYTGGVFDLNSYDNHTKKKLHEFNKCIREINGQSVLIQKPDTLLNLQIFFPKEYSNFQKYQHYPQLFMGLGIFGTFLGLSIGLFGLGGNFTDSNLLLHKVEGLISGMTLAFGTSLVGMTTSLFASYFMNSKKANIVNSFQKIYSHILEKTPYMDKLDYYFCTTEAVKGSNEVRSYRAIDTLYRNMEESSKIAEATTSMNNDLANQIAVSIHENIEPTLNTLNSSIESFVSDNKNGAQDAIAKIIQNLEVSMKDMVLKFKDMISEDTKNELSAMATMLSESGEYFVKIPEVLESVLMQIEEQQKQHKIHYKEINDNLDTSLENFNVEINRYNDSIARFDSTQDSFQRTLRQIEETFQKEQMSHEMINYTMNTFDKTLEKQNGTMNQTMEQMTGFMQQINSLGSDLDGVFRVLNTHVGQYEKEVGNTLSRYLDGYSDAVDQFTYKLETAVNSLQGLMDEIQDQNLVKR